MHTQKRAARLEAGDKVWVSRAKAYFEVVENHKPDTDSERHDWHHYRQITFKNPEGIALMPLWLPSNTKYFVKSDSND